MFAVTKVIAREILDSRGIPTVEVEIWLNNNSFGRAATPSGASIGSNEITEIRDGDPHRYHGRGVQKVVNNVNTYIARNIVGGYYTSQQDFDAALLALDTTPNKSLMGGNAIVATSIAFAKAVSNYLRLPLFSVLSEQFFSKAGGPSMPLPMFNVINGGFHADNSLDIQEFLLVPKEKASSISENIRAASEICYTLKNELRRLGLSTAVGDEGGFAPALNSTHQAMDMLCKAIEKAGYSKSIGVALDAAATTFYDEERSVYHLKGENKFFSSDELISFYQELLHNYPTLLSIEDPLAENDFEGWKNITKTLKGSTMLVGDDIFVSNKKLLQFGIDNHIANGIIIKPNQVGTLTETMETVKLAMSADYKIIMSHRSGETEDTYISHMSVAVASYIKAGSVMRSERTAKYNELLRILENLA